MRKPIAACQGPDPMTARMKPPAALRGAVKNGQVAPEVVATIPPGSSTTRDLCPIRVRPARAAVVIPASELPRSTDPQACSSPALRVAVRRAGGDAARRIVTDDGSISSD